MRTPVVNVNSTQTAVNDVIEAGVHDFPISFQIIGGIPGYLAMNDELGLGEFVTLDGIIDMAAVKNAIRASMLRNRSFLRLVEAG